MGRLNSLATPLNIHPLSWLLFWSRLVSALCKIGRTNLEPTPPVLISVTSYPPRFPTLLPTFITLVGQKLNPNNFRAVLTVFEEDADALPTSMLILEKLQMIIILRSEQDLGIYMKLSEVVREFPEASIATFDDDMCYRPDSLSALLQKSREDPHAIVGNRGYRLPGGASRGFGYDDIVPVHGELAGDRIFLTGAGGIYYPNNALKPPLTSFDVALVLANFQDDVWYLFSALQGGISRTSTFLSPRTPRVWVKSQGVARHKENVGNRKNDGAIQRCADFFARLG